jgi:hypothetical protein
MIVQHASAFGGDGAKKRAGARGWSNWVSTYFVFVALLACAFPAAATEAVDLEIVIATDVSQSIDEREAALQRQGFAAALRSREVIRAIESGALGKIAVAYIDWSSEPWNRVIVDWQVIHDGASAHAFADALLARPRTHGQGTSIGGAMRLAAHMIESNTFDGMRRVIDISGDGPNNRGALAFAREDTLARGITINGLPIITDDYGTGDWGGFYGQLDRYYETYVIGGPGAFSLPARGFEEFATAIRRKLILEISGEMPANSVAATQNPAAPEPVGRASTL